MLLLHEIHHVRGRREDDFEAAYRSGWMPSLARDGDARLLWYTHHAHGSGPAYHVVTITAVGDGAAYERLVQRVHQGDADTTVPPQHARRYAAAIPGAQLQIHLGDGHFSIVSNATELLAPLAT